MSMPDRYAFGNFVLERAQRRVLQGDGSALSLTPRLFDALLVLVENAGVLVEKNALMLAVWPGLVVEENNLSQTIFSLRRALGDDPHNSRYIQTVPRRGFRFIAKVTVLTNTDLMQSPALSQTAAPIPEHGRGSLSPVEERPLSDGVSESALNQLASTRRVGSMRRRTWLRLTMATGAIGGLGAAGWLAWRDNNRALWPLTGNQRATLAVLPFKPLLTEGRDELLEIGMTDSLITRLSTVPGLVVRSVGAVRRYGHTEQDPLRAARELDVQWVVDGTLQRRGDKLRVTARLLWAADGSAAWSGSFDEKLTGIFDLQDQISRRVLDALRPKLQLAREVPLTDTGGTRSPEAYQLYLAAAGRAQGGRAEDTSRAIAMLQQALSIDPNYAMAWSLQAWIHRRDLWNTDGRPADIFALSNEAVQRALTLAPGLAQARASLGFSRYYYDFDWQGAEREFRAALQGNPNEVSAHWGLAQLMLTQGRIEEGFEHMQRIREIEPISPVFSTLEASFLLDQGQLAGARSRLALALDIAPKQWLAHVALGLLLMAEGQPDQGLVELRRAVELSNGTSRPRAVLAAHLARRGQVSEARALLAQLQAQARSRYMPPTSLAAVHAALGQTAPALDALEQAVATHDSRVIYLKDDPFWVVLRKEPRFVALIKKLHLDRYGPGLSPV